MQILGQHIFRTLLIASGEADNLSACPSTEGVSSRDMSLKFNASISPMARVTVCLGRQLCYGFAEALIHLIVTTPSGYQQLYLKLLYSTNEFYTSSE